MATTQEIEQAGIRRELKMMAVDHAAKIIAKLGLAASADEDVELLQLCHAFCVGSNGLLEKLDAENHAAFDSYLEAEREVQTLEAMLAVGGEEVVSLPPDEIQS